MDQVLHWQRVCYWWILCCEHISECSMILIKSSWWKIISQIFKYIYVILGNFSRWGIILLGIILLGIFYLGELSYWEYFHEELFIKFQSYDLQGKDIFPFRDFFPLGNYLIGNFLFGGIILFGIFPWGIVHQPSKLRSAGERHAIIIVLALPPRESCNDYMKQH